MANEIAKRDQNSVPVLTGVTDDVSLEIRMLRVDPVTGRLLISVSGGGFTELTFTGTVDGVNTSFTTTQEPTYVVSDGVWYKPTDNNGNTIWTWNGTNTVTMVIPPSSSIWGFA